MFQKINRALRSPLRKKKTACNGQVAIILILVIAAGLIFFAVSLNLGQFALTRAIVTIASNTSASMLASNMASYGQMLSETQLDGKLELCKWSGLAAAIVSLLAAIIGAILAVFTAGSSLAIVIAIITGVIGVGLATAAVVMQLTVQPGLTTWWNSVINETLSTSNQVTENAISAALEKAVTDAVNLPDTNDSDGDRIWADAADLASAPYADEISRYGQYYTMRLQQIKQIEPSEEIVDFIGALREFLYEGNDGWGIYDPMTADLCKGLAECHMCCVPNTLSDGTTNARPATCQNATDDNFWGALCESASPYQLSAIGTAPYAYGWLYDNFFENPYNGFFSLREWIGRDDEHKDFYKDPTGVDPNSVPGGGTPSRESQRQHADAPVSASGFRLEDTTGFYVPPYYDPFNPSVNPPTGENRKGIFPFFYKMADWGVDLSRVRGNISADLQSRECHWCDVRDAACIECAGLPPHDHPLEIPQLSLPVDPASLKYDQSYFVEGVDNAWDVANPENPPLAVDRVTIDIPGPIIATDDQCAEDFYPGALPDRGFWRRGADRFCADTCPYYGNCAKCSGADGGCQCDTRPSGADPASFPDDALDDLIYGMTDFIEDAEKLLVQAQGALVAYSSSNEEKKLAEFTSDFLNWYDDIAKYIEPGSADGVKDPDADVPCFWCDGPETIDSKYSFEGSPLSKGILYIMLDMMMGIRDRLQAWVLNVSTATGSEGENIGYPGQECTEVWCVPDATLSGRTCGANGCVIGNALPSCQIIPKEEGEQEAFNTHMTFDESDVQGDVIDIVGCLNYNVNGYDHVAAAKLKRCLRNPISANCNRETVLPNWHLDGTTPYEYPEVSFFGTPWDATNPWFRAITQNIALAVNPPSIMEGNSVRFQRCSETCGLADCHHLPRSLVRFVPDPVNDPTMYFPNGCPAGTPNCESFTPWDRDTNGPMSSDQADADWEDLTAFNDCLRHCSPENCRVGPRLPVDRTFDNTAWPRAYPGPAPTLADCDPAAWHAGNAWYDAIVFNRDYITPAGEKDMPAMVRCFADCTVNIGDCMAMSNDDAYSWPGGASPATFNAAYCTNWMAGNEWYDAIIANVKIAGGGACDVNPNTDIAENPSQWRANTAQSALEAENQVVKFAKRRDFLSGRVTEVENIIRILDGESPCVPDDPEGHICETAGDEPKNCSSEEPIAQMVPCAGAEPCPSETMCPSGCDAGVTESYPMYRAGAIDKFVDFLCGPAADLIRARIDPPEDLSQEGLPFHAIYGWRDEPKDVTADPYSGKWHIVKVEARIPGMCDSACGVTQAVDSDPTWPRVETETSSWGLRRCYYLTNTDGVVKFRVTRFDQDKTSNPILFPNGIPIWRFKSNNPLRMLDPFVHNPSDLTALCDRDKVMLPGEGPADVVAKYKGAFMLNSYDVVADANAEECWDLAHALLSVGAVNETCAQYYWHGSERGDDWDDEEVTGANPGMGLRFVPCQPF